MARRSRRGSPGFRRSAWTALGTALAGLLLLAFIRPHPEDLLPGGPPDAARLASSPHVALGVPADADPSDDLLLDEHEYVVSHNPVRNAANWVSWRLDRSHLGPTHRRGDFRPDPQLPFGVYRATPDDYRNSGYDRGHLCPSADRTRDPEQNSTTFLMTNMQPQLHELNAGPWERLEQHERELAQRPDAALYVIAGGIFDARPRTIGHGVSVPRASFKIIVPLRSGQTAAELTPDQEIIAVILPNESGVARRPWTDGAVPIDEIERQTGYDFLSSVPVAVQAIVERAAPAARPR